ncbi:hypothetical protein B1H18_21615 [Streptomyces tsukubensis]|uniref:Cellulose-binding protein n=1 Tax=Streptomyces tsukubensis TaxID=83656 RepID=A0A1V4A5T8_9ACTN|nr:hypothetical protein B1H18_21615 [Streptomyces tsukubensis]
MSASPHGFAPVPPSVRSRGYRPGQVDPYVSELSGSRDAAWERAARLTVLAKEMRGEADRLRDVVAKLAPQTYEALGERAVRILALGEEEAAALWEAARVAGASVVDAAGRDAADTGERARAHAGAVLAEAGGWADERDAAARAAADEIRKAARRDVKEWRGESLAVLRDTRQRCEALLAAQEKEQADRWEAAEGELAEREAGADAYWSDRLNAAEEGLAAVERDLARAAETARHTEEDARARGVEALAEARSREERVIRETDRVLRDHEESREELRARLDHVRGSLAALTGRGTGEEGEGTEVGDGGGAGDTAEEPGVIEVVAVVDAGRQRG